MEDKKVRKMRFWIGTSVEGSAVTALNKKLLREAIAASGANFKGTKIRQFEVQYTDHADLALKLMGASVDALLLAGYANVLSEYDA